LTSEKYPSGKVYNYSVDDYGRLQTVADAQRTYLSSVSFTNQGLLSSMNLGNGTSESFDYNDRFQMKSQSLNKGSQVLQKYDYGYGKVDVANGDVDATKNNGQLGRIESFIGTEKQSQQRFDYDSIGRLSESREYRGATNTLTYKEHFDFDRFGNLYRKAANNSTTGQANPVAYTPIEETDISKATNRFTTATNTTYNEAGMVVGDNKFRSMNFAYDANGRQVKATKANVADAWSVYDALGNRVATKVNDVWQFVIYDAFGKLVAEYGTQGEGLGGVSYVLQDWQGSVRASVNANGFIQARFDFTAFGEEVSLGVGLRSLEQGYTGDATTKQGYGLTEKDSSGLNHAGWRKNENRAGRWTSPDPYNGSMKIGNPQSFNKYSYVESQPTNFVDPSGLNAEYKCETWGWFRQQPDGSWEEIPGRRYQKNCVWVTDDSLATVTVGSVESDSLNFNSCAEFVDYLLGKWVDLVTNKTNTYLLGRQLMDNAVKRYGEHINNGYKGFKETLVGKGVNPQGAGIYGHILINVGADIQGNFIFSALFNVYDTLQYVTGQNPQAKEEVKDNIAAGGVVDLFSKYDNVEDLEKLRSDLSKLLCN
jgi:RHS repeat-associated protein